MVTSKAPTLLVTIRPPVVRSRPEDAVSTLQLPLRLVLKSRPYDTVMLLPSRTPVPLATLIGTLVFEIVMLPVPAGVKYARTVEPETTVPLPLTPAKSVPLNVA